MRIEKTTLKINLPWILCRFIFLIITANISFLSAQDIVINEFLASNSTIIFDPDYFEYSDWIELKNCTGSPIDLGGYYLTDNLDDTTKWQFSNGTIISANGYLLIWADGTNGTGNAIHTNFKLEKSGEEIGLFSPAKEHIDNLVYGMQETDVSCGRNINLAPTWYYFSNPTPGSANIKPGYLKAATPNFSLTPGFYSTPQVLEFDIGSEKAEIRYTLDGSIPDVTSDLYTGPITIDTREGEPEVYSLIRTNQDPFPWLPDWVPPAGEIFKSTVVRARAFEEGMEPSKTVTLTYFVDPEIEQRYPTIPVISLVSEQENLFDYYTGIYVPGFYHQAGDEGSGNYFQNWEKPAHIEFFEPGGTMGFSQDVGIRIQGGSSPASPQKAFHVIARNEYGNNRIEYPIFWNSKSKAKNLTEFKRFIIRAWGSMIIGTLFSDAYAQSLFEENDLDIQAYRPAAVFINGEYWGLHEIREANKNSWYYQYHYGIDRENPGFDLLEHEGSGIYPNTVVDEGDADNWNSLVNFVETHDMSNPENFEFIEDRIDIDNFITYLGHCIYTCKWDWPNNNDGSWRIRTSDARWKWIQFDMETCFGVATALGPEYADLDASYNMLEHVFNGVEIPMFGQYGPHRLAQKLIENETFRDSFIQWFAIHMKDELLPQNMNSRLDTMAAEISPYMEEYRNRWPFKMDFTIGWDYSLQLVRDFIQLRPQYMNQHILEMFGVNLAIQDQEEFWQAGNIHLGQNWPNPANDFTRVLFTLSNACRVVLTLYSISGQEITTLENRFYSEGEHIVFCDLHNVPQGTYVYRFTAGMHTEMRKLVIIK